MRRISQVEIKSTIEKYLQDTDNYQSTDDILIEELVFNFLISKEAKADIKKRGIILNKDRVKDEDGVQRGDDKKNKSWEIYLQSQKEMKDIFVKLSLSPQERNKLKIELTEKIDEFDQTFKQ